MRKPTRWWWSCLATCWLSAAYAQAATEGSRERSAHRACLSGDPTQGVRILSDLFLDTGDATYIFNQGRCYQQNERYQDAIARFRVETIVTKRGRAS